MSRTKINYINNADFLKSLLDHKEKCRIAKEQNKPEPKIPDYLGFCWIKIAENLAHKPNFSSYTFKEDMIADGIENAVQYYRNFNPEISQNPFAYFTQIIYYAFLRRIVKEKKQLYIKYKATEQFGVLDEGSLYEDVDGNMVQFELYTNISEFIKTYEEAKVNKKLKKERLLSDFELLEKTEDMI